MDFFGDVTTACGLDILNKHLESRSYVAGFTPSKSDAEVFKCLAGAPSQSYPHALRWYKHISIIGVELRLNVQAITSASPVSDSKGSGAQPSKAASKEQKPKHKPGPIAKSSVMLGVKPWDDETDMKVVEDGVRQITMDGLSWGASKLAPLAYGINKLNILCIVKDEKVSIDDLVEKICENEDFVQSVDVGAFNIM